MSGSILIVEAPYYEGIAEELRRGAEGVLKAAGVSHEKLVVPGALEIPGAIVLAEETGRFEGYVALGCVIRGETGHYDIVAGQSAQGLMMLTLEGLAVGNGILTCENKEQAMVRADVTGRNKGAEAVKAVLAMIEIRNRMIPDG